MVRSRSKTGREATRKHAQETRELALFLFHNTAITRAECARMLRVKEGAVKGWWEAEKAENRPPHRGGMGSPPKDYTKELETQRDGLLEELKALHEKLAEKEAAGEIAQKGTTSNLIRDAKLAMVTLIHSPTTKLGELASTVRALAEIEEIERLRELAENGPKVLYYLPESAAALTPAILLGLAKKQEGEPPNGESNPDHH